MEEKPLRIAAWQQWAAHSPHVEFILFPSRYLHSSWRTVVFPDRIESAALSPAGAHKYLSRHVATVINLPAMSTPDFNNPAWEVAMLDGELLERLVQHVGATAAGVEIRNVIDRRGIQSLIEQAGRDLYTFMLERAVLICAQPIGPVLPRNAVGELDGIELHIRQLGRQLLKQYMDRCDSALWARARLKLAHQTAHEEDLGPGLDSAISRIVAAVRRELR
jgi:hypothetical protein